MEKLQPPTPPSPPSPKSDSESKHHGKTEMVSHLKDLSLKLFDGRTPPWEKLRDEIKEKARDKKKLLNGVW